MVRVRSTVIKRKCYTQSAQLAINVPCNSVGVIKATGEKFTDDGKKTLFDLM